MASLRRQIAHYATFPQTGVSLRQMVQFGACCTVTCPPSLSLGAPLASRRLAHTLLPAPLQARTLHRYARVGTVRGRGHRLTRWS